MSTLAVLGTAGGVGASTLAALAFAGARHHPNGAPTLVADGPRGLAERVGDDSVAHVNPRAVVWDVGTPGPEGAAALLERADVALAVAAPRTPLGLADAEALVAAAVTAHGEAALDRISVVLSDVYRLGRALPDRRLRAAAVLHVPYDPVLAAPGPVPPPDRLGRRTSGAVDAWVRLAVGLLVR